MSNCSQAESVEYREVGWGRTKVYRVGSDGSSWSSPDCVTWRRLNPSPDSGGYPLLWIDRKSKKAVRVHVAVLTAFAGPPPEPGLEACHRDDDKSNSRADNLYWGTHQDNLADMVRNGGSTRGERNHHARLTADQVRMIVALRGTTTQRRIAERFGIAQSVVSLIVNGRIWGHVTGIRPRETRPRNRRIDATPPA